METKFSRKIVIGKTKMGQDKKYNVGRKEID
jgi:hypothetical protein